MGSRQVKGRTLKLQEEALASGIEQTLGLFEVVGQSRHTIRSCDDMQNRKGVSKKLQGIYMRGGVDLSSKPSILLRLVHGAAVFGSRNVFLIATDFLSALLLIRFIPITDYGRLTLALSARSIGTVFLDLRLGQFITAEVARCRAKDRPDQVKRFLLRYGQMNVLVGGGFIALALGVYWLVRWLFSPLIAWLALIVGVDLFITAWRNTIITTFRGYTLFTHQGGFESLESFSKLGLIVLLVIFADRGVEGAILIYPLSTLIALLLVLPKWLGIVASLRQVPASREPVFRRGLCGPGKWAVIAGQLKQVQAELPVWVVRQVLGVSGVAVYAVAQKGYTYTVILLKTLEETLLPLFSENVDVEWEATHWLVHSATKYALVGAIALAVVGLFLAPFMYDVIFEYPTAVSTYRVLLACLPVYALGALHQRPMLVALQGQKYEVISSLFSMIWLALVMSLGLIWLGVVGAAVGLFVNACTVWVLRYAFIRRLKPEFHVVWGDLLRIEEHDRKLFAWIWKRVFHR